MVTTKLNLSMTEPSVRQIYAKQGDTGRVLDISLDQTPEDGTLRLLRPDGVEVTSEAVTGGEVESGGTFESLTEADVTELTVDIEPVQDLSHGDPSPTNICPITGHDEVRVTRTGKNLLNPTLASGTKAGLTAVRQSDKSYSLTGTATETAVNIWIAGQYTTDPLTQLDVYKLCYLEAGTTITFKDCKLFFYDVETGRSNVTFGISNVPIGSDAITLTVPRNAWLTGVRIPDAVNGDTYNTTLYPQIELGSTATSYEPYQGSTYTTSLGQTVYGGTLDMVTGVLTVTKVYEQFSSASLYGNYGIDSKPLYYVTRTASEIVPYWWSSQTTSLISNYFRKNSTGSDTLMEDGEFRTSAHSNPPRFFFRWDSQDLTGINSAFSATPFQTVAELVTPVEYQLTPQQIKTLVGTNNVWASSGDIVSIKFTYGGMLSELPSDATSVVGKCYCDVEQNGVSSMPFTLNVKKNERES